jgi:hypothetical protein
MTRLTDDMDALWKDRDGIEPPPVRTNTPFKPHRVTGLAARLMARSNCIEHVIERDGRFAEPFTTRHWSKP